MLLLWLTWKTEKYWLLVLAQSPPFGGFRGDLKGQPTPGLRMVVVFFAPGYTRRYSQLTALRLFFAPYRSAFGGHGPVIAGGKCSEAKFRFIGTYPRLQYKILENKNLVFTGNGSKSPPGGIWGVI